MSYLRISIITIMLILGLTGFLFGQVPQVINYQGRLTDATGDPVADGDYTVWFRLYDQNIDGNMLWEDDILVSTSGGFFNAKIGGDTPLPSSLFRSEGQFWLSMTIDGEEILPRTLILAVPFAMVSDYTLNLTEDNVTAFWTLVQSMPDADGDGYNKLSAGGNDCDDFNAAVNPGGSETFGEITCHDGLDNDCDGLIDGADPDCSICQDADGDGFDICDAADPNDTDGLPADCDDSDPAINPGGSEVGAGRCSDGLDNDCDGYVDDADSDCVTCEDVDGDGYDTCNPGDPGDTDGQIADCDDQNANVHPGATEFCDNNIDDDCDGLVDAYDPDCACADSDGDGYDVCNPGDPGDTDGLAADCDDQNGHVHPNALETCDNDMDDDCDGLTDGDDPDCACADVDGDGFDVCNPGDPGDTDGQMADCDDQNANVHPGAIEIPGDGIDQDCDGGDLCYLDNDDDGYRPNPTATVTSDDLDCFDAGEATPSDPTGDCNDQNPNVHPGATEICDNSIDDDCDGDVDGADSECACADVDGDGYDVCNPGDPGDTDGQMADCDDQNANIHPGATEIPGDGIDQDCDGGDLCYLDNDDDGFRPNSTSTVASGDLDCSDPGEANSFDPVGDCDDSDPGVHPGATEIPGDGIDQDCDGGDLCYLDNDDDGYRPNSIATIPSVDLDCSDPGEANGYDPVGDCDDQNANVHPGATEICDNAIDDDCDGDIDDADSDCQTCDDVDQDGYDTCNPGDPGDTDNQPADCDDQNANVHPGAVEIPGDGIDQDCDGGDLCYLDNDDDGYRPNSTSTVVSTDFDCSDPGEAGATDPTGDCDDNDASIHPGATEVVGDGIDQDCNGGDLCYLDADNDGYRPNSTSTVVSADLDCSDPGEATPSDPTGDCDDQNPNAFPGNTEYCDGVDNDCNNGPDYPGETVDADGDGFLACYDCDDSDPNNYPGNTEVCDGQDNNCNGSADYPGELTDNDGDGYPACVDCDDNNPNVHPGAVEICGNSIDDDCDGLVDGDDPDCGGN